LFAGSLGESHASLRPSRGWQGPADGMGWFPFARLRANRHPMPVHLRALSSRRPAQLTAPLVAKCPSTGSGRTAASWPGVSTLACPERLPGQAAEGLDTNGVSSLRAQRGNPVRQALAIVAGRSGLPRRCAPRNDGGVPKFSRSNTLSYRQAVLIGIRHGQEKSERAQDRSS
jgi:hypothetical protein